RRERCPASPRLRHPADLRHRITRKPGGTARATSPPLPSATASFVVVPLARPEGTPLRELPGLRPPLRKAARVAAKIRAPSIASKRVLQSAPARLGKLPIPAVDRDAGTP